MTEEQLDQFENVVNDLRLEMRDWKEDILMAIDDLGSELEKKIEDLEEWFEEGGEKK